MLVFFMVICSSIGGDYLKDKKINIIAGILTALVIIVPIVLLSTFFVGKVLDNAEKDEREEPLTDEKAKVVGHEVIQERIQEALNQNDGETNFEIASTNKGEGNDNAIELSDDVVYHIKDNKITLVMNPNAKEKKFASLILVGVADDNLSFGDRNIILNELGLDYESNDMLDYEEETKNRNVKYTYKGTENKITLEAEIN